MWVRGEGRGVWVRREGGECVDGWRGVWVRVEGRSINEGGEEGGECVGEGGKERSV